MPPMKNEPDITLVFPASQFLINDGVFPPLGILYLSAFLKQRGEEVQCLDMGIRHTPDMAKSETIGISITTPQRLEAYKLAKYYNKRGRTVIAGGPHATYMEKECLENGFHSVVKGEGELSYSAKHPAPKTIDAYPFPDRDALPIKKYKYTIEGKPATPIMTSRGCPYACSFCAKVIKGFRMQSAERTIREIEFVHNKYGFEAFMIFDDIFVMDKERLFEFVLRFEGSSFVFRCFGRANLLDDITCLLLSRMGVVEVGIGIESGSDEILAKNMKGTNKRMNKVAVETLRKYGIRAKAFLIVGLPGETHRTVAETISWIEEVKPDDLDVTIFQPLPGSAIFDDPDKWGVKIFYDGSAQWYKGKPGEYIANVETDVLSCEEIVAYRDVIEKQYKKKELLK